MNDLINQWETTTLGDLSRITHATAAEMEGMLLHPNNTCEQWISASSLREVKGCLTAFFSFCTSAANTQQKMFKKCEGIR